MDRISGCNQGVEGVRFVDFRIGSLLFADYVVLLAHRSVTSSSHWVGSQPSVKRLG